MKKFLLIFLFFKICFNLDISGKSNDIPDIPIIPFIYNNSIKWEVKIKNETGGDQINVKPGIFSKIYFQLTNSLNQFLPDDNKETSFILSIEDDDKIRASERQITLDPKKSLVYSTYIGFKCKTSLKLKPYEFIPKVYQKYRNVTDSIECKGTIINIVKNEIPTKINLDFLMYSMPGKSFSLLRMDKEIYNVDEINIQTSEPDDFDLEDIDIKPFIEREELSENNIENHGFLFKYPFEVKKMFNIKDNNKVKINIKFKSDEIEECFALNKSDFEIFINNEKPATIDNKVKKSIKYNTEDQTSTLKITNSLKIKTFIPVAPVVLTCEAKPYYSENIGKSKNITIYKNFITNKGNFDIIINNLEFNEEFSINCEFKNTAIDKKEIQAINITIGNSLENDINLQLLPSRDSNVFSQCANFTFTNERYLENFRKIATNYCKFIIKKNELFPLQSLPTIVCEEIDDINNRNSKTATICVAPLPLYNNGNFIFNESLNILDIGFKEYINKIKKEFSVNEPKISKDIDIKTSSINAFISKIIPEIKPNQFNFDIKSTHLYPIECYFNTNLEEGNEIKLNNYIILYPNEEQTIKAGITLLSYENKMYSLYFKCYNLPGFKYKNKNRGLMTIYTYLDSKTEKKEKTINIIKPTETSINCYIKENQLNPRCLKDKIIPLSNILKTDIPLFIKKIDKQVPQFSSMIYSHKYLYLENLLNEFKNISDDNTRNIFEKSIEIVKFLTNIDCTVFTSGSTNNEYETINNQNYVECRKRKQNSLKEILNKMKGVINCSTLSDIITEKLGTDEEENIKYILFLINELSNNPDSYIQGQSQSLIDISICLQEKFENFSLIINDYDDLDSSKIMVKKDLSYALLQTLTNLAKVIHYDEIDGYIDSSKKTKNGLIISENTVNIQKKIIEFSKTLNEFGDELYNLSSSMFVKIESNNSLVNDNDTEIKTIEIPNKDILLKIYSNYMIKHYNAKDLQILVFDSPLVSVKSSGNQIETSDSLNTFISIILYNEKGEEIPINSIDEKYRPEILYLKSKYENLKKCYYYNEEKKELVSDGIIVDENFEYNGKKYFKCVSEHLTAFTAGTYNFNSEIPWWIVAIIISSILLFLLMIVLVIVIFKKRAKNKPTRITENKIESEFCNKESLINN